MKRSKTFEVFEVFAVQFLSLTPMSSCIATGVARKACLRVVQPAPGSSCQIVAGFWAESESKQLLGFTHILPGTVQRFPKIRRGMPELKL